MIIRESVHFGTIAACIYFYAQTLVSRFISYKKDEMQQACYTKVFTEHQDGLLVLGERHKVENEKT